VIDEQGIQARVERLERLSKGLAKEVALIGAADDPLLYLERKAYLAALRDGIAGLEGARVILARARQRLADDRRVRPNHVIEGADHERVA
jgi:hypothetical protein